jgi:tripartite-type tricarboxylate transporter receptor subunit TctC
MMRRMGFALAAIVLCTAVKAQPFPSKPLRIVVPFPPGGAADITSRVLGEFMAKGLGQPVLVENRPGGSTMIGSEVVARAPADGHTLLVVFPSFIINPSVRDAMAFHPLRDFRAVGQSISLPMVIAVHPSVPARTLQELVQLARDKPGQIAYGTPGTATTHHIMGEMLNLAAKVKLTHAPFQGGAPALNAVSGGHIQMVYANTSEIAGPAKTGRVRAIIVTSAERADVLPEVPTMREAGYPELEATNWAGTD